MNEDVFLQAILEEPDDDTHRLVYSDWLEEHGDAAAQDRATLIRAQIQAEQLPVGGRKRKALERTAKKLIKAHPEWTAALREVDEDLKPEFRRGFVHHITVEAYRFVNLAEAIFQAAPTIRSINFPTPNNEVTQLAQCPYLARLTEADLSQHCTCGFCGIHREMIDLFASPYVNNLTRLGIVGNRIDRAGAEALAATTNLPKLRDLDMSMNSLGNDGARALLRAPWLEQLTRLVLTGNNIGIRATRALQKRLGDSVVF